MWRWTWSEEAPFFGFQCIAFAMIPGVSEAMGTGELEARAACVHISQSTSVLTHARLMFAALKKLPVEKESASLPDRTSLSCSCRMPLFY